MHEPLFINSKYFHISNTHEWLKYVFFKDNDEWICYQIVIKSFMPYPACVSTLARKAFYSKSILVEVALTNVLSCNRKKLIFLEIPVSLNKKCKSINQTIIYYFEECKKFIF